jgi:hypothetical protein
MSRNSRSCQLCSTAAVDVNNVTRVPEAEGGTRDRDTGAKYKEKDTSMLCKCGLTQAVGLRFPRLDKTDHLPRYM